MTAPAPTMRAAPVYTDGWARIVNVLRWFLVAALVLDAAAGLLAQPRRSVLTDLHSDLAAGKVRSIAFVDHDEVRYFRLTSGVFRSGDDGPVVLWRVGAVDYRVAHLGYGSTFIQDNGNDSQPSASRLRAQVEGAARAQHVPIQTGLPDLLLRFPQVGLVAFLLLLLVMLRGGQPRLATRWATFWLLLSPMNIGMLRILIREAPWSPEMRAWPEPPPHRWMPDDRRLTGGGGFVQMLFCYICVGLAVTGLTALRW
jgi:hypothetical protein